MRAMIFCGMTLVAITASTPAQAQSGAAAHLQKQIVPKLVKVLEDLGNGQTEAAIDKMETLSGRKFKSPGGPSAPANAKSGRGCSARSAKSSFRLRAST